MPPFTAAVDGLQFLYSPDSKMIFITVPLEVFKYGKVKCVIKKYRERYLCKIFGKLSLFSSSHPSLEYDSG
jgi:hypothetical protein